MPLEHILRAMQAQAEVEIDKVTRAANEQAAQLIAEAQAEASSIRTTHRARVEPMLVAEAASIQNKAKLGALRASANAREQLLVKAFSEAEDCLAQIRASKQYSVIFRALVSEALQSTGGDLVARVDPRDPALAKSIFAEMGLKVEIEPKPTPLGGLELATRDGRIAVVNTLAARLERSRNALRGPVAAILAGQPESKKEWTTSTATPTPA